MFGWFQSSKRKIEFLEWKIKSMEERQKEATQQTEKALQILRKQVVALRRNDVISDEAILNGYPFDVLTTEGLTNLQAQHPNILFLDVRTAPEVAGGFIPNAVQIPVDQLPFRWEEIGKDFNRPIVAYCASGARSQVACEMLAEKGFRRLFNLRGGVGAYPHKLEIPVRKAAVAFPDSFETDNQELYARVEEFLRTEVNPGVASHGGMVSLLGVREQRAFIRFGGGCHGCGQVDATLKDGILRRIREVIPQIEDVVDITDHSTGENPYFQPHH